MLQSKVKIWKTFLSVESKKEMLKRNKLSSDTKHSDDVWVWLFLVECELYTFTEKCFYIVQEQRFKEKIFGRISINLVQKDEENLEYLLLVSDASSYHYFLHESIEFGFVLEFHTIQSEFLNDDIPNKTYKIKHHIHILDIIRKHENDFMLEKLLEENQIELLND